MLTAENSISELAIGTGNPFPGLRPFYSEESHLFFGREGQVEEVLKKLKEEHFVAVVGTSGIGKSSFMQCALLPVLQAGLPTPFSENWEIGVFRPGIAPLKNMSKTFSELEKEGEKEEAEIEVAESVNYLTLQEGASGLVKLIEKYYAHNQKNYLVFIDQFEELFRFRNTDPEGVKEANAFINLITEAVAQREIPVYFVLTMRSDFIGECAQFPKLTKLINDSQFLIPQMGREEKRRAIVGPVGVMEAKIDDTLVEQILNDIGDNSDGLPIMQHALMRTWNYWQRTSDAIEPINISHYEAIGGVKRALSVHGNEIYDGLNEKQKKICEKVFKTITEKGEEGRGTRRPSKLKEIAVIADTPIEEVIDVIDQFRKPENTLLSPSFNRSLTENSVIDVSHESLMRIWVLLNNWLDEEAESVKMYLRLAEAAEMHQLGKAGLWRPPDLQIALNWQMTESTSKTWGLRYNKAYERTMLFLEFSKKEFEKEQLIKEKLQKRRLVAARISALILGLGAIVAFLFFLYGEQQRREAEAARYTAVAAQDTAKVALKRAVAAKIEALSEKKKAETAKNTAEIAKIEALLEKKKAEAAKDTADLAKKKAYNLRLLSIAKSMAVKSVSLTDKEREALVAQQAYKFNTEYSGKKYDPDIYDALYYATKRLNDPSLRSLKGHTQNVRALASTPTGTFVYSAGSDGKIFRWDLTKADANREVLFENPALVHMALAVSPDNKYLVVGGNYAYLQLFDLNNILEKPKILKTQTSKTWFLGFTPDSKGIISAGLDNKIVFWDFKNSKDIAISDSKVNSIAISPIGSSLAVAKVSGEITLLDRNTEKTTLLFKDPEKVPIVSVAFSKNGLLLAAGDEKGIVHIWDMETKTMLATLTGHTARVNNIQFSNDGERLATASFDKTVRIWNIKNIYDPPIVLKDHDDWVWSIEFSPDGKKLLAGCKDSQIRVWPTSIELMKDIVCSEISRNLSKKEWEQFVADDDDIHYEKTCPDKPEGEGY